MRSTVFLPRQANARALNSSFDIPSRHSLVRQVILSSWKKSRGVIFGSLLCGQELWQRSHPHTVLNFRIISASSSVRSPFLWVMAERQSVLSPRRHPVGQARRQAPQEMQCLCGYAVPLCPSFSTGISVTTSAIKTYVPYFSFIRSPESPRIPSPAESAASHSSMGL